MAWSGSLTESSAVGSSITFTPDTSTEGAYTVAAFTAPRKGVYAFQLKGSGGTVTANQKYSPGGVGGFTTGYLLLEKGQTVYVGAGGTCSAAFVSKVTGAALKNISASNLFFVAGAGGGGGAMWGNGYNNQSGSSGGGGGTTGLAGWDAYGNRAGGSGATQSGVYGYDHGGGGGYANHGSYSTHGGRGGDGYYGGNGGGYSWGGGGGSGYIHATTLKVNTKTFTNSTQQGGGAGSNARGSVQVSYHARAELPIKFNGTTLERLFFNGVEVESLIYDGVRLFMRRVKECLSLMEPVFA